MHAAAVCPETNMHTFWHGKLAAAVKFEVAKPRQVDMQGTLCLSVL